MKKNILIAGLGIITIFLIYSQITGFNLINAIASRGGECQSPIAVYEDPSRIPLRSFVLREMGDLKGKTVVDIGAGLGFFAFEMAEADKIYATETDPLFLNCMKDKRDRLDMKNMEGIEGLNTHEELENLNVD